MAKDVTLERDDQMDVEIVNTVQINENKIKTGKKSSEKCFFKARTFF
jgi:hypothetical protein